MLARCRSNDSKPGSGTPCSLNLRGSRYPVKLTSTDTGAASTVRVLTPGGCQQLELPNDPRSPALVLPTQGSLEVFLAIIRILTSPQLGMLVVSCVFAGRGCTVLLSWPCLFGLVDISHMKLEWHLGHTSAKAQKPPFIQLSSPNYSKL